jgi:hydrogenase-4 component F
MITSTGIIFALLGTMFLANAAGGLVGIAREQGYPNSVMNWTFLMQHGSELKPNLVRLSFLFILIGYGTKAGFAPMHTWLPDGHGEAPAPISALLSGVLLKSALYVILRFYTIINTSLTNNTFTSTILLGSAMLSLVIATPFILKKNRFKRVLAYHSLEHMGIITFGIGIGGSVALFGALLHTLNHAITKSLMFLSYGNIWRRYREAEPDARSATPTGVLRRMPITGAFLSLGGLALVGTPPFNVFMSEWIMLWGALQRLDLFNLNRVPDALWWLRVMAIMVFILSTTLIFYGLVRHLARMMLSNAAGERRLRERFSDLVPLVALLLAVIVLGVWIPPALSRLIALSVEIVSHT